LKAAVWKKKKVLVVEEVPEPQVGPYDVKVKVDWTTVCGSDPHIVSGALPVSYPPRIMGHEMSGTVAELGEKADIKGLQIGDRVTGYPAYYCGVCHYCRTGLEHYCLRVTTPLPPGTMAEYVVWKEQQIYKAPEGLDPRVACLAEPVSVCLRGIDVSNIRPGSTVLIMGAGGIGLILLQLALRAGATLVVVSEPVAEKRRLAEKFGAGVTLDPASEDLWARTMQITKNMGFDTVIEASGNKQAAAEAITLAGKAATVIYFAVYPMNFELPIKPFDLYARDLTLRGVFMSPYTFPRAIALLPVLDLEPLLSISFPLDQVNEAFAAQLSGEYIKILVESR
jgi:(R,R)-butanediol dehydrogenase / meso-butanediol dehydrogenase / diacetyl reductase